MKCVITDPLKASLKAVSFDTDTFFMNCAPKFWNVTKVTGEADLTRANMKFNGLRKAGQDVDAIFVGSSEKPLFFQFGQTKILPDYIVQSYPKTITINNRAQDRVRKLSKLFILKFLNLSNIRTKLRS